MRIVPAFTSLKAKFITVTILILTAAIGGSSWRTLNMQEDQLIVATEEKVIMLALTVEKSITTAMLEGQSKEVQAIVLEVVTQSDIDKVQIFDEKGKIRISSEPEEIGKRVSQLRLDRYLEHLNETEPVTLEVEENARRTHSIIKPILNRPECYGCHEPGHQVNGILRIDLSLAKTKAQIASISKFVLFSAILTIASLSLGLWILLSRLVSRPVSALIQTMRTVESGELNSRLTVNSRDELGQLGQSFNYMISSLQEAKQELEAQHQGQLERAEKMASLGQLASAIAHEVKNPLAGMSGAMQILAEDYRMDDPKREVIEEMLRQIRRLDKTVKDLLSYARPVSPDGIPCNASDLVEKALFFIRQQDREPKVSIVTDYAQDLPQIHADPQQIQQVFLNIALNAVQAMPEGGTLTVKSRAISYRPPIIGGKPLTASVDEFVEVAISDTGIGIPSEDLKKVFQPFLTTKAQGTGLGLAIASRIIEQHGGQLRVESEVGKGSTFWITLPIRAEHTGRSQDNASEVSRC